MTKVFFILLAIFIPIAVSAKCIVHKDIAYRAASEKGFNAERHLLDIYAPKKPGKQVPVLIYIHGGSWNSGNKNTYRFLGKGFASKNIITVIINYRLTPEANYAQMADDCASAVKWVTKNISQYGGDTNSIFISGHSAGGHLAALISTDQDYFNIHKIQNPLKGCILLDAFGLDMVNYFPTSSYSQDYSFKKTFTTSPDIWKEASPQYHVSRETIPHLIFVGEKTYASIATQAKTYKKALSEAGVPFTYELVKNKKHIGMIFQFVRRSNPRYKKIIEFINTQQRLVVH